MPDRIIRGINGPRGSVLVAAAWVCVLHGIAYTPLTNGPVDTPLALQVLAEFIPLEVYGLAWLLAGTVALVGAFRSRAGLQRDHADAWGFGLVFGMFLAWSIAYASGWIIALVRGEPSRAWITAGLYVGVALIVLAVTRMTNPTARRVVA